jgi:hypothetical protein
MPRTALISAGDSPPHRSVLRLDLLRFSWYFSPILLSELVQLFKGETLDLLAIHLSTIAALIVLGELYSFCFLASLASIFWEIFESAAWLSLGSNLKFQIFSSIDLNYVLGSHLTWILYAVLGLIGLLVFLVAPRLFFQRTYLIPLPAGFTYFLIYGSSLPVLLFFETTRKSLYPFNDVFFLRSELPEIHKRITRSLSDPRILLSEPPLKKNLIVIQLESLEKYALGEYSPYYPGSMPYLSSLARNTTIADNLDSQPYTTWTASGTLLTRCGFPQIIRDPMYWENRKHAHLTQLDRIPCYPDFLRLAGYDLYCYLTGSMQIMGVKAFFKARGYKTVDMSDHSFSEDWDVYHLILKELPDIIKQSKETGRPFVVDFITENTHPPYNVDPRCDIPFAANFPQELKAAACLDQTVHNFMDGLKELNITAENSEILMHADHICYGDHPHIYDERKLFMMLPFRKQQRITKNGTYYDIPPTVMEILNFSYSPEFAFGKSLFSEEVGPFPNVDDFGFIHSLLAKYTTFTSGDTATCKGKKGFCTGYM